MLLNDFDFYLPEELIARYPLTRRDASRLLHIQRLNHRIEEHSFSDIVSLLKPDDVLIFNNTKVRKVRFYARSEKGRIHELLFASMPDTDNQFHAIVSHRKKLRIGMALELPDNRIASIVHFDRETILLQLDKSQHIDEKYFQKNGVMPIPPYLNRQAEPEDDIRYQTVFAEKIGALAAPTASLHFTESLFKQLQEKGVQIHFVTLYVGLGTFIPIRVENIAAHTMHEESFEIEISVLQAIEFARQNKKRIIAVGTTVMRLLESIVYLPWESLLKEQDIPQNYLPVPVEKDGLNRGMVSWQKNENILSGQTSIFISPGYSFQMCQGLITNFHTPKSSLLILVSAFYERERILKIYEQAVAKKFRFYSYGDAMFFD